MLLAVTVLELVLPGFNTVANKVVSLNYFIAPMLLTTAFVTAVLAGAYPSYLITDYHSDALKDANKGQKGGAFRAFRDRHAICAIHLYASYGDDCLFPEPKSSGKCQHFP